MSLHARLQIGRLLDRGERQLATKKWAKPTLVAHYLCVMRLLEGADACANVRVKCSDHSSADGRLSTNGR
jgi:hypothetical protein